MKIRNDALQLLLKKTKRPQAIDGKVNDQVHSCILRHYGKYVSTCSLVKDGVSSLSHFSSITEEGNTSLEYDPEYQVKYYITDIDKLLGVLKYHGQVINLTQSDNKLKVKSSNKQTTLSASPEAMAYPHNPSSLKEWEGKAQEIKERIHSNYNTFEDNWAYETKDGELHTCQGGYELDATTLFEALRCDSMNGQKVNQYRFFHDSGGLHIETGGELKGKTKTTLLCNDEIDHEKEGYFDVVCQGGLEQLFSNINGLVGLFYFDFTKNNQGIKVLFDLGLENGEQDFVFQSGLLE